MRYRIIALMIAGALAAFSASAQNLNPQVQVTNDYKARMGLQGKQGVELEIPDSLRNFRSSVDYNVLATPYKGAYEFSPYEIAVAPQKSASGFSQFFLRAGLGYSLRPVVTAVYTPLHTERHSLSVYQDLEGYVGNYRTMDGQGGFRGYDFLENAGIDGRLHTNDFSFTYGLDYKGIFTDDRNSSNAFNDITLRGGIRSDVDARIVFAADLALNEAFDPKLNQTGIRAKGYFKPVWSLPFDIRVDASLDAAFYSDVYDPTFVALISPKALFEWDFVKLEAGVALSPASDIQWLFPDARLTADFADQSLQLYAFVKGGQFTNTFADLKLADHWFNTAYTDKLGASLERLNAGLGARGSLAGSVQYDLRGGYAAYSDVPLNTLTGSVNFMDYALVYDDYGTWYADLDLAWKTPLWDADATLHYRYTDIELDGKGILDLPRFAANAHLRRNWNSRIYAGLRCEFQSRRDSATFPVDGFVNVGLEGEYKLNSYLGVWTKLGNILNQKIALSPLHIEDGIFFSAGICLNLR